jgi:hypothetical protein
MAPLTDPTPGGNLPYAYQSKWPIVAMDMKGQAASGRLLEAHFS